MRLKDKVALITGSTRSIGRAIAEDFLAEGASVVLSGRSREKGARRSRNSMPVITVATAKGTRA